MHLYNTFFRIFDGMFRKNTCIKCAQIPGRLILDYVALLCQLILIYLFLGNYEHSPGEGPLSYSKKLPSPLSRTLGVTQDPTPNPKEPILPEWRTYPTVTHKEESVTSHS